VIHDHSLERYSVIKSAFDKNLIKLPTIEFISNYILFDCEWEGYNYSATKSQSTYEIKEEYVKHSFCILTDEFVRALSEALNKLNVETVTELACGPGWLSWWLVKYKTNIVAAVDDKSWKNHNHYLPIVKKCDAIEFVKKHPNIDAYILSWPYMDNMAAKIWRAMKKGRILVYIGESTGGCTADEEFFDLVEGHEMEDLWELEGGHRSFWGVHDKPTIYRK